MFSLGKTFRRYTGLLRSWKAVYIVNNLLNSRRLQHNRELYRKHGLQKSIYAPIGRQDFSSNGEGAPWLDRPGALLDGGPRTATAVATTDVTVLVLTRPAFNAVLDEIPTLAHRLLVTLARRLRDAEEPDQIL